MDKENANPIVEVGESATPPSSAPSPHGRRRLAAPPPPVHRTLLPPVAVRSRRDGSTPTTPCHVGSDVRSDEEEEDVKTRQVSRRRRVGQYISYAKEQHLPNVGTTVNVHSFRAKHALGMHLQPGFSGMPPLKPRGRRARAVDATAGFDIDTEADDYFPNEDFFPDISNLFNDMALNGDNVNAGSSSAPHYSPVSFASSLKPPPFEGVNYKRWRARAILWLTTMRCFDATKGKPEGELTPLEEKAFEDADTLLRGAIISVLGENIVDSYLSISTGKDMWDAIEAKFGVSDAGSELYVMEQFYDFKMTNERSIVEQAHEIQSIAKELEQFTCVLPDKFIAGGIIAKLPPSWRNFATSLKHKRQEFSTTDLIGSLDVEEKARAKDTRARGVEGGSSANLVQKNFQSCKSKNKNKYDGKEKFDGKNKASQSTNFKRKTDKKKGVCHVCGDPDHWAPNCPNRFDKRQQGKGGKTANVVIGDTEMKDVGYGRRDFLRADGQRLACYCSWCCIGYRFLIVKSEVSDMHVGTIMESNDATFFEDIFPMKDMPSSSNQGMSSTSIQEFSTIPESTIPIEHLENMDEDNNEAPKRSKRQRTAKSFGNDFIVYLVDDTPTSISEAYASQADYWKEAVRSEMDHFG
ncbi:hypothetical protein QYE76_031024 [Lolium multiflorum]|uniref:CCHC-type domain-containing protein n=1 Tax=Lolium multiflorum TaxID=4521 RepID=A0AAD8QQZ6_LOLMU|nr:hypothetical protein QYE76_031024 [Lolium multiflorum]